MNLLKFGETFNMATPSQATKVEGVETRREPSRTDEGIVQTTNCKSGENRSGKKISWSLDRAGSSPALGTNLAYILKIVNIVMIL